MSLADYTLIVAIGLLSAATQYLLKTALVANTGAAGQSGAFELTIRALANPALIAAIGLYAITFGIYALLLAKSDVSQIFPAAIGVNILCVATMACFILGESVTIPRLVGMATIAIGVYFVSRY